MASRVAGPEEAIELFGSCLTAAKTQSHVGMYLLTLHLEVLSILDTYRFHSIHIPLLYTFCAGMLASAALTSVVDRPVMLGSPVTEVVEVKRGHRLLIRQ